MNYESKVQDVSLISNRFSSFFKGYDEHFRSSTRTVAGTAQWYGRGLMTTRRRTCQSMAMELGAVNDQQLHHLLTQAKWDAGQLMDRVTADFAQLIENQGLSDDLALLLTERIGKLLSIAERICKNQFTILSRLCNSKQIIG